MEGRRRVGKGDEDGDRGGEMEMDIRLEGMVWI